MVHKTHSVRKINKVGVIGTGLVGSTFAYTLIVEAVAQEIVLIDIDKERASGEAMDINHSLSFSFPSKVYAGDYDDLAEADIIVITAGVAQKAGQSRLVLTEKNVSITKDIMTKIKQVPTEAIIIIVSNPVDVLTYEALKISGFPKSRVIGSGTLLDTSRLKYEIASYMDVDPRDVHAYILGEHGDSEVPIWSLADIAGSRIADYCAVCKRSYASEELQELFRRVKNAAYDIIKKKGATYYAIALGTTRLVEAILGDYNSIMTVSCLLEGEYGIEDVCLSMPALIGRQGIKRIISPPINDEEVDMLRKSAQILKDAREKAEKKKSQG